MMDTARGAELNRRAWDSCRQRDEGLVGGRRDVVMALAQGHSYLGSALRELAGDVRGKRLLDLGCGDGAELLEWARLGATVVGVDHAAVHLAAAWRAVLASRSSATPTYNHFRSSLNLGGRLGEGDEDGDDEHDDEVFA